MVLYAKIRPLHIFVIVPVFVIVIIVSYPLSPRCFAEVLYTSIQNVSAQIFSHITSAPSHQHICSY